MTAAQAAESLWQTIESAPKSSRAIMVYVPHSQCTYIVTWGETHFGYPPTPRMTWRIFGGEFRESLQHASHWMPIPPPPKEPPDA